jgi:hypothetical protein
MIEQKIELTGFIKSNNNATCLRWNNMKIIFDKLQKDEQYPISARDIKLLFSVIPKGWVTGIKLVHFLGQDARKSRFERPVNRVLLSNKLNICTTGFSEKEIVTQILIELVQDSGDSSLRAASYNKLTKSQTARIHEIIEPYLNQYFEEKQKQTIEKPLKKS